MPSLCEAYDIAVIGAGHAGCEAALAAARLGCRTALFTLNLDAVANMPCNPSIGGTAKGHIVFEMDALGGLMPQIADAVTLQSRMLNRGKGPAVRALRAQCDRADYHARMKAQLENTENLFLIQGEVVDIGLEGGAVAWVETRLGARYPVGAAILATGTYLGGRIFVGDQVFEGGPDNAPAANLLSAALTRLGLPLRRFKTGTPPRIDRRSVALDSLESQPGDEPPTPFSVSAALGHTPGPRNRVDCHIAYTNAQTHRIIADNLQRSAMYSGHISGIGARYCPSIEDKIVRFANKPRHQLFVEPMGLCSGELYLQGFSTSMPYDLQVAMLRSIAGFEQARITRPAYAIEYDCTDPTALYPTLEFRDLPGLYGAGQFNGTSGYEEAAAQGLVAGINAAHRHLGRPPLTLDRGNSYIGLMIDDLTTKGCTEPYRMLTSRSENRLILRQDNTRSRLGRIGADIGLIPPWQREALARYECQLQAELARVGKTVLPPSDALNAILTARGSTPVDTGATLAALIRRPQIGYADLAPVDPTRPPLPGDLAAQVETEIRYAGYIEKQQVLLQKQQKLEHASLSGIDFSAIGGLRIEARQKLMAQRPQTLGQASRLPGVNPADVSVLAIYLHLWAQQNPGAHPSGEEDPA